MVTLCSRVSDPDSWLIPSLMRKNPIIPVVSIILATRRSVTPLLRNLFVRPKWALVSGLLAMTISVLTCFSWFHTRQAGEAIAGEVILRQIAALTRQINTLTMTALQEGSLSPEAEQEIRAARRSLSKAVLAAHLRGYHAKAIENALPTLDIMSQPKVSNGSSYRSETLVKPPKSASGVSARNST